MERSGRQPTGLPAEWNTLATHDVATATQQTSKTSIHKEVMQRRNVAALREGDNRITCKRELAQ
jgi:hypothetical protein|tara:strand:+ start:793 stop:984 length:192 start_codon:yes stop_codon:yes gene_type:complete